MDKLTTTERSLLMARVRSKNTNAEMVVRKLVHQMGYRYRLHVKKLPGSPDLVFGRLGKIILVNGCFWHSHSCRAGRNRPASHTAYWLPKLKGNQRRDRSNAGKLKRAGWSVLRVWECQTRQIDTLSARLRRFLESA